MKCTQEEKKALEEFKKWLQYEKKNKDKIDRAEELIKIQTTLLNLIEKQQKEIEIKDKRIFYLENEARNILTKELDEITVDLYKNYISTESIKKLADFGISSTNSEDDYSIGMRNGIIYLKSVLLNEEPIYFECKKGEK